MSTNSSCGARKSQGLMRLPQILELIPVGKSTWWAGVKSGKYPPSIKIGPRTTVWRAQDIHDLVDQLANGEMEQ
ncbi:AlpA family phage regulatory protein [Gilvimarinus sp. SDUM040013]|uniref:AlpA family phage regulatory protein n=1 Tax=Gilvimarinus gilvus TaxID=3058038 RepID=A0ABU4RUY9_9GAMM|nr:AlpA family phage regulatory protein [Gilvimarinus sp. SDUM040013]MDO3387952.1 AlpA family phage regulatory protein [Gilvimarinus sp. SDUM040013]MDX6848677.1 AlpA family phage regulatory protein [Gilvimarinus sp. SDUM040013]